MKFLSGCGNTFFAVTFRTSLRNIQPCLASCDIRSSCNWKRQTIWRHENRVFTFWSKKVVLWEWWNGRVVGFPNVSDVSTRNSARKRVQRSSLFSSGRYSTLGTAFWVRWRASLRPLKLFLIDTWSRAFPGVGGQRETSLQLPSPVENSLRSPPPLPPLVRRRRPSRGPPSPTKPSWPQTFSHSPTATWRLRATTKYLSSAVPAAGSTELRPPRECAQNVTRTTWRSGRRPRRDPVTAVMSPSAHPPALILPRRPCQWYFLLCPHHLPSK